MACVRKRGGRWEVDFYISGKRKKRRFKLKKEANAFLSEVNSKKDVISRLLRLEDYGLKEAIRKYFELFSMKKSLTTQKNEKLYFEKLYEKFGDVPISSISLLDLEEFQSMLGKSIKSSTINRHFNCYKHFFNRCVKWDYIEKSPALDLERLKSKRTEKRVWKDSEIQVILSNSSSWFSDVFYILAHTGIRAGEATRLTWSDVNFEARSLRVTSKKGTGDEIERVLPLSTLVFEFLVKRYLRQPGKTNLDFLSAQKGNLMGCQIEKGGNGKDGSFSTLKKRGRYSIFLNASGKQISSTHLSRECRRLCQKFELEGLTLHGLRHTFITRLALANVNAEAIRILAGHSNLKTTQGYLHVPESHLRETVEMHSNNREVRPEIFQKVVDELPNGSLVIS